MDFQAFKDFGLAGLVIAALLFIIWRIIAWAMKWFKEQAEKYMEWVRSVIDQQAKERLAFYESFNALSKTLQEHNEQARNFHTAFIEANRYIREEHTTLQNLQNATISCLKQMDQDLDIVQKEICKLRGE